ncbi:MAG: hypothetical protein JSV36_19415 [Anaerolineae bacterium]|nr:MAG: hypothetical protein JSV36_19415 [Anaerolineae bacterium]
MTSTLPPSHTPTPTPSLPHAHTPTSSRPPAHTPTPIPPTPTPTPPPQGGHIVEVGLAEVATLNPLLAADDDDLSRAVGELLFDGLLRLHPQTAALLPGLARDWQVSPDGRTFTFHLRSDVTWHDGQPLTAADVVFTLGVAGDPQGPSPYRLDLAGVAQLTAPTEATVNVTLGQPGCDAPYAVGRVPILPRHLLEGKDLVEAAFNQQPVGSGPFRFVAWDPQQGLALKVNENYWAGRPYLDGWTYRLAPNVTALQDELRLGHAHLARWPAGLETASLPDDWQVIAYPADGWYFLALNNDGPILDDATVRQALALALDRERLLDLALDGQGTLMDAPWLATHWALDRASLSPLEYDPEGARRLLAEAGWRDDDEDGLLE